MESTIFDTHSIDNFYTVFSILLYYIESNCSVSTQSWDVAYWFQPDFNGSDTT